VIPSTARLGSGSKGRAGSVASEISSVRVIKLTLPNGV
jgi:hypothetical protein